MQAAAKPDPCYEEAIAWALRWHQEGRASGLAEPDAATLATSSPDGHVTARTVLVREISSEGFVFYTNTQSPKGRQLAANPRAALCYHWDAPNHQLRVEGRVVPVDPQHADAYWATRPRLNQIASMLSRQSEPLESPESFEQQCQEALHNYEDQPIPRPAHWTGYRLVPDRLEFFIGRPGRLNERVEYRQVGNRWEKQYLYP